MRAGKSAPQPAAAQLQHEVRASSPLSSSLMRPEPPGARLMGHDCLAVRSSTPSHLEGCERRGLPLHHHELSLVLLAARSHSAAFEAPGRRARHRGITPGYSRASPLSVCRRNGSQVSNGGPSPPWSSRGTSLALAWVQSPRLGTAVFSGGRTDKLLPYPSALLFEVRHPLFHSSPARALAPFMVELFTPRVFALPHGRLLTEYPSGAYRPARRFAASRLPTPAKVA